MTLTRCVTVGSVGTVMLLAACGSAESNLRTAFADEYTCPEHQVSVTREADNIYRASGCNKSTRFLCGSAARPGSIGCEERRLP
jgi:hypothetical protein